MAKILISLSLASPKIGQSVTEYTVFFEDAKKGPGRTVSKIRARKMKVNSVSKTTVGMTADDGVEVAMHMDTFNRDLKAFSDLPKVGDTFKNTKDVVKRAFKLGVTA